MSISTEICIVLTCMLFFFLRIINCPKYEFFDILNHRNKISVNYGPRNDRINKRSIVFIIGASIFSVVSGDTSTVHIIIII